MANHIVSLLENWFDQKDELDWVLATVIATEGSSYRKPGAMMLINSLGQYSGLVSGGCLESDIMRQSRKCWFDGAQRRLVYDMQDEDDIAWKLGIGCGGRVEILLQPVNCGNQYLQLPALLARLRQGETVYYSQSVDSTEAVNQVNAHMPQDFTSNQIYNESGSCRFIARHVPRIQLAIFGAGVDARPVAALADTLGWQVSLFDERQGYAKAGYFPDACLINKTPYNQLDAAEVLQQYDAVVIMNHNIRLDAAALQLVHKAAPAYTGILGPAHRTERVLQLAGLTPKDFTTWVASPAGLSLGGELPESVALSIITEIHARLHTCDASPLSTFTQPSVCLQITA